MAKEPTFNFGANANPKKRPAGGGKKAKAGGSKSAKAANFAKGLRNGSIDFSLPD